MIFYVLSAIGCITFGAIIALTVSESIENMKLIKDNKIIMTKKLLDNAEQAVYLAKNYSKDSLEMAITLREEVVEKLINKAEKLINEAEKLINEENE